MNAWFPHINLDGSICSGNSSVWVDGIEVDPLGSNPVWAARTLIFRKNDTTISVDGELIPGSYNAFGGSDDTRWLGFSAPGNGRLDVYDGPVRLRSIENACAGRLAPNILVYLHPYQTGADNQRTLFVNDIPEAHGIIMDVIVSADGLVVWQIATGIYTRALCWAGGPCSIRDDENPVYLFIGPEREYWIVTATQTGTLIRPLHSPIGYRIEGELFNPDARVLDGMLQVVGSDARGNPLFDHWFDFTEPRIDLRPDPGAPPIEPPIVPPIEPPIVPPIEPPPVKPPIVEPPVPGQPRPYYEPKEYSMTPEIGSIKGPGNKYGRVVREDEGKGAWGWYPIRFDRDTPDDDCLFELTKPDERHQLRHTKIGGLLGADATEHSEDIPRQFYLKPDDAGGRGILESPVVMYDPCSQLVFGIITWPEKGVSGPAFTWEKRS